MNQKNNAVFAGYVPVLHRGYLDVLRPHADGEIRLFDQTITQGFDYLRKDIRTLQPEEAVQALAGLGIAASLISKTGLEELLASREHHITLIDDDITEKIINEHHPKATISYASPFLRWDRRNSDAVSDIRIDATIDRNEEIISLLYEEASRSSDWWRHVGAAILDGDAVIRVAHNHGVPHAYINSIEGDPRSASNQGASIENSLFIHAEGDLIARCARDGISTKGKDIYVTTFPCPNCAKLIAASGITTCYFVEGYAALEGERTLRDAGVAIIKIHANPITEDSRRLRPYPKKS